jgi:hypothetical protein
MSVRSARYNRLGLRSPKGTSALPRERDAWRFLDTAGITSSRQQEAIIQLVRDLKQANLWTKMKAIYPFVGGTATTHKWNLKDPQDTDAAFRLTFNGGWTHASTGALPNGTNGWANTNFNGSTQWSLNDSHFSVYTRTNSSIGGIDIGVSNSNFERRAFVQLFQGDYYGTLGSNGANDWVSWAETDTKHYVTVTRRTSTDLEVYKNGVSKGNNSKTSTGISNVNIPLSAYNFAGSIGTYSDRELAFVTLGSGLTDAEATLLYNCVDRYQKFLGRAV